MACLVVAACQAFACAIAAASIVSGRFNKVNWELVSILWTSTLALSTSLVTPFHVLQLSGSNDAEDLSNAASMTVQHEAFRVPAMLVMCESRWL